MTITYSSGIITVTGGTEGAPNNFQAIYDADVSGGWGVSSKQGNQFRFNAPIVIGDGSTQTWFIDTNKSVEITATQTTYRLWTGSGGAVLHVRNGTLRLGQIDNTAEKATSNGCTITTTPTSNIGIEHISCKSAGNLELYSTKVITVSYGYIWHESTIAGKMFRIWNCAIGADLLDQNYIGGTPQKIADASNTIANGNNITNSICIRLQGVLSKLTAFNGDLGAVGITPNQGVVTRDLYARNNNHLMRAGNSPYDAFLIDTDTDTWSMRWDGSSSGTVFRQWSHNFSSNAGTSSLRFALFDKDNTAVFNDVTDAGGVLTEKIVTEGYYNQSNGSNLQSANPHLLRIRKYGRIFIEQGRNVSAKTVEGVSDSANSFIVANEATAGAYTGIAINGAAKTITLTGTHSVQELYDYSQWWAAQSGNMQYDAPITTADGSNFSLPSGWVLNLQAALTGSKTINASTFEIDTGGNFADTITMNGVTLDFQNAGTLDYRNKTFAGTIELVNSSGGNVTVQLPFGTSYNNTSPATITVEIATVDQGLAFTNLIAGSQVIVFQTGTQTVIDSVESSGTSFTWQQLATGDITVDYTIINEGYFPQRVTGVLLQTSVVTVPVQQTTDRAYEVSSGLTFGTTASVNTGTSRFGITTASTVQNWYSFMMESWRNEAVLKNVAFPISTNGSNSFTLGDGWEWDAQASIDFLKNDGMRYVDASGAVTAIWAAISVIGDTHGFPIKFQQQEGTGTQESTVVDGMMQVMGDSAHGNFDYRDHFVIKIQGEGYDESTADGVATYGNLEDQYYVLALNPLANGIPTGDPAITGVTITDHGASPVTWNGQDYSITIQDSGSNTGEDIMRWLRYNFAQGGVFQGKDAFNWHDLVQVNGSKFKTVNGVIYGDVGAALKGVRVVTADGTSAHPDFDLFTADNGAEYVPPLSIVIANPNLIDGSRAQLYNVTQDAEMDNIAVSGGGGYSYATIFGAGQEVESGDVIRLRATYANGASYKENYEENAVATTSGITFIGSQTDWEDANLLIVDGSAQTEFAADYPNVQIDITASGDTFNVSDLIAWTLTQQTTADGIRNFFGVLSARDAANWVIENDAIDLHLDNTKTSTATQNDAVILMRDDNVYPQVIPTSGGGGIGMIQSGNTFIVETGTSGLTPQESTQLFSLPDETDTAAAVWSHDLSGAQTQDTSGDIVKKGKSAAQNAFAVSV